jgi:CRP/FNR family transcriptional activator FtrB
MMRARDFTALKEQVRLFAGLSDDLLADLLEEAVTQLVPARAQVIEEGRLPSHLFLLLEGAVELYGSVGEREASIAILEPGSCFILAAVIINTPQLMSARTLELSRLLVIPARLVRAAFAADEHLARAVAAELAGNFRTMVRQVRNQLLRTGVQRLANYLVSQCPSEEGPQALALAVQKKTLASMLGLEAPSLSRAFAALKQHGVGVDGRRISISDIARLKSIAKSSEAIDRSL